MTQIEKSTVKTVTAISAIIVVCSSLATGMSAYYGFKEGMKDAIKEVRDEMISKTGELEKQNAVQDRDISELQKRTDKMEDAAMTYFSPQNKFR